MGDSLSQDEINSLLSQSAGVEDTSESDASESETSALAAEPAPAPASPAAAPPPPSAAPAAPSGSGVKYSNQQYVPPAVEGDISMLSDIDLNVSVILAKTGMPLKDALALKQGVVVELDRLANEPVDIYVNQRLFAKGEVVVIDENFGVRLVEILNPGSKEALIG